MTIPFRVILSILYFTLTLLFGNCSIPRAELAAPTYDQPGIIFVKSGEDLQAALDRSIPGDVIKLEAKARFEGPFVLRRKADGGFITITTSRSELLPADGIRIDPKQHADALPMLVSPTGEPVLSTAAGAHHYRFVGIEFGGTRDGVGDIIRLGTGKEENVDELPHHIEFDRVYIHSTSPLGQRRGIAANGRHIRIANSHISDIKRKGDESQAIAAWATDGPIEIVNNYLEAAAENILFGGAGSVLKLVPSNCVVERNHLNKPEEWRRADWVVKNLFEIKNGRKIVIRNNLMTNNWTMAQDGTAILFTTRADNGPATVIEDIEFVGNVIRNSDNGISIFGEEGSGGHRLAIRNNIFDRIGKPGVEGTGRFMKSTTWKGLVIENNTIVNSGNIASAYGAPAEGFTFRNNIVFENEYGFKGDSTASGAATLEKYFPNSSISGNAIIGGKSERYYGGNTFPRTVQELGIDLSKLSFEVGNRSGRNLRAAKGPGHHDLENSEP